MKISADSSVKRGLLRGKSLYATVHKPRLDSFGKNMYQVTVEITDDEELKKFQSVLSSVKPKSKLQRIDRKTEEPLKHPTYTFRLQEYTNKDGSVSSGPKVVDKFGNPLTALVGNGSDIVVQYRVRSGVFEGHGYAVLDLEAVQVLELVEYIPQGAPLMFKVEAPVERPLEDDLNNDSAPF